MSQDRRTVSLGLGAGLAAAALDGNTAHAAANDKGVSAMTQTDAKPDLAARLQALDDRRQIEEVRATYGWFAARGDAKGLAACFTEDCHYEGPAGGPGKRDTVDGRAALEAYLSARLKPGAQTPFLYNHILKVTGDTAEGSCAVKPHVPIGDKQMVGFYLEKFNKVDGHWKIKERLFYLYQPYYEI